MTYFSEADIIEMQHREAEEDRCVARQKAARDMWGNFTWMGEDDDVRGEDQLRDLFIFETSEPVAPAIWHQSKQGKAQIALQETWAGDWDVWAVATGTHDLYPCSRNFVTEKEARAYANLLWLAY